MKFRIMTDRQDGSLTPGKGAGKAGGAKPEAAFDLWLQRGLHQIFDDVAREPIPDELLRLIEDDRSK